MDESKAHWKWQGGLGSLVELLADHLVAPKERRNNERSG
jgi:hypothetical protein